MGHTVDGEVGLSRQVEASIVSTRSPMSQRHRQRQGSRKEPVLFMSPLPRDNILHANNFDLLRLLSALQVLAYHSVNRLGLPLEHGWWLLEILPGVPVFFAISGFLIAAALERQPPLRRYVANRLYRTLPGLWFCVLLTLPIAALSGIDVLQWQAPVWLLAQMVGLIYTPAFLKEFGIGSYNGSLWTIPVELQFYVLLPLLFALLAYHWRGDRRLQNAVLTLVWIGFVGLGIVLQQEWPMPISNEPVSMVGKALHYSFLPHFHLFLVGVLMQRLRLWQSPWIASRGLYWIILYAFVVWLLPDDPVAHVFKLLMLGVTVIACAYTVTGLAQRFLGGNDISYGVYIYHGLLINFGLHLGAQGSYGAALLLVICSIGAGWLSWQFVERPMLAMKKRAVLQA